MNETLQFLALGGPIMIVIGIASLIATTLFIERLWALQRSQILPSHFTKILQQKLQAGELNDAKALCEGNTSALAAIVSSGLQRVDRGWEGVREAMQDHGRIEAISLEKHTGIVGAIANVTPLLGLLGTITGMIKTFQELNLAVEATGQVSAGAFASGIWEALITTAAGLTVAIPSFLAYKFLVSRVDALVGELEETTLNLVPFIVTTSADKSENKKAESPA